MWFAVLGDLRFLSHHELMRLMARALARAGLPVKTTRGFNPHPKLSLPLPKPVAVASVSELLVAEFEPAVDGRRLRRQLGRHLPPHATVQRCQPLPPGRPPKVVSADYVLPLLRHERPTAVDRLEQLARQPRWELVRPSHDPRRRQGRALDIKPSVRDLRWQAGAVHFTIVNMPSGTARCQEVLKLVGGRESAGDWLARLTRTSLECEFQTTTKQGRDTEL